MSMAALSLSAQSAVTFEKSIGGKSDDIASSVIVLEEGYLVVGKSKSFSSNFDFNVYVIRLDAFGNKVWSKHFGSSENETANGVVETQDGFTIIGSSDKLGNDRRSLYLLKISKKGQKIWERAFYSYENDYYDGNDIVKTDEGYMVAATEMHPRLFNPEVNAFIVAADEQGMVFGRQRYGGVDEEKANAIIATDDGYVIAGSTDTWGHGDIDAYVFKIDKNGKRLWHNAFGGGDNDIAYDIIETDDGYLMVGKTDSFRLRNDNIYVVKMDREGNRIWHKAFGGEKDDIGYSVVKTEGGYVIAGSSISYGKDLRSDLHLMKINENGRLIWVRTYGGRNSDAAYDVAATDDGFIAVGKISDERTQRKDIYIVKTDKEGRVRQK